MGQTRLVVVVPAIAGGLQTWQSLLEQLQSEEALKSETRWLLWDHKCCWYSLVKAKNLAIDLRAAIDQAWTEAGGFQEIILMGHSLGGLLVRQAYLLGLGVDDETKRPSDWARHVTRLVLFAAVNRGVNCIDPKGSAAIRLRLSGWSYRVIPILRRLLVYDVLRGSDFVTNLRIQWIRQLHKMGSTTPTIVQLLGTKDDLVNRQDSIDIEQFPTAWHVDVPEATHGDLHRLDKVKNSAGRYALIRSAILDPEPMGGDNRKDISGPAKVIFVLHGIMANNWTWVQDIADLIAKRDKEVKVIKGTYGYFSALKFALPTTRKQNLFWFQDQYTERLAQNPNTEFRFIGHSNGTYLFGHSLRFIPGMSFEKVVLAGSVLPPDFPWREMVLKGQIKHLRNLRSNRDFPVSFLCSALRGLGMRDVGPGGFEGFRYDEPSVKEESFWYDGGHSRPLDKEYLNYIVSYILDDEDETTSNNIGLTREVPFMYKRFPRTAPWIVRLSLLLLLVVAIWWVALYPNFSFYRLLGLSIILGTLFLILDII